jgi:hypothetical protein
MTELIIKNDPGRPPEQTVEETEAEIKDNRCLTK